jgi:D-3-phosphoglycerate dehydrogenase
MIDRPKFKYASDVEYEKAGIPSALMTALLEAGLQERVIVTPKKQGAETEEANRNCGLAAARQVISFFKEGDTSFCVYKTIPPSMQPYANLSVLLGKLNRAMLGCAPKEALMTFYGETNKHREVLSEYVLKGTLAREIGSEATPDTAARAAKDGGVISKIRMPEDSKGYGNAITIDFLADAIDSGVRGRIEEGRAYASRIGKFIVEMPLHPDSIYVIAEYEDRVGMADEVGAPLKEAGYNRISIGVRPDQSRQKAMAFWEVEKNIPYQTQVAELQEIVSQMRQVPGVKSATLVDLH